MTLREVPTIASTGEQVDGASLTLSNEATDLLMAQATRRTDKVKDAKPATDVATTAPAEKNDGPLAGLLDPTAVGSPTRLFPDILKADEKWQAPYKELTKIDGHNLLERHGGAMRKAQGALYNMPQADAQKFELMADDFLGGRNTPEQEKQLAGNLDLYDALKVLRTTFANPNLGIATKLRQSVASNMGESISLRTTGAEELTSYMGTGRILRGGGSLAGGALGLIVESKELARYKAEAEGKRF